MVIAPRPDARSRREKGINDLGCDRVWNGEVLLAQKSIEHPQGGLLHHEPPSERALVGEVVPDPVCEHTRETDPAGCHSTSSPSPQATARRVSTSTLL